MSIYYTPIARRLDMAEAPTPLAVITNVVSPVVLVFGNITSELAHLLGPTRLHLMPVIPLKTSHDIHSGVSFTENGAQRTLTDRGR